MKAKIKSTCSAAPSAWEILFANLITITFHLQNAADTGRIGVGTNGVAIHLIGKRNCIDLFHITFK